MDQDNMKGIAEQVLEGKSLLSIDFGDTGLTAEAKLALIDLALKRFPRLPSGAEPDAVVAQELDTTPCFTSAPGIPHLVIQPPTRKQDLFILPVEIEACADPSGSFKKALHLSVRARRVLPGGRPGAVFAFRRGWKISLAQDRQEA